MSKPQAEMHTAEEFRTGGQEGFDTFLSYSHALDGRLAPALQRALEAFAKPFFKLRMVRIFRDETSLSVHPDLWPRIETALDRSRYLILLASPRGASSRWVRREVAHWLERKAPETILVVLTHGRLTWDPQAGDLDWKVTDALPDVLRGRFKDEPLYIDMSWAHDANLQLSLHEPRFADAVLSLSATIRNRSKNELGGDAVRAWRQARRLAVTPVSTILIFAFGASLAAYVAIKAAQGEAAKNAEAQIRESLQLAQAARDETAIGDSNDAANLALAALPSRFDEPRWWFGLGNTRSDRPIAPDAYGALIGAISSLQEEAYFRADTLDPKALRFTSEGFIRKPTTFWAMSDTGHFAIWKATSTKPAIDVVAPIQRPDLLPSIQAVSWS